MMYFRMLVLFSCFHTGLGKLKEEPFPTIVVHPYIPTSWLSLTSTSSMLTAYVSRKKFNWLLHDPCAADFLDDYRRLYHSLSPWQPYYCKVKQPHKKGLHRREVHEHHSMIVGGAHQCYLLWLSASEEVSRHLNVSGTPMASAITERNHMLRMGS
ncbi:hypothetical protein F5J12DRAFT_849057 [Pisolithus orientalis]|uniref:uncharacterized protein n=1 Tax=Pisolithus orientalis TaxID=936130 RepID=UPI00222494BB|nr:uncharacterized protein F5J12DRAFT_849057 [Pisolithus orientalis]KAI5998510.1 hypothetical protein F5J12DRAFT_849057 [Pisolithus orientalis]